VTDLATIRPQRQAHHQGVPIALMRLRNVVDETARVWHFVPVHHEMPDFLTAFCGTEIGPGQADLVVTPMDMTCESCIARAPLSGGKDHSGSSDQL